MPSEPVLSGSFSRMARPALVVSLGLAVTVAPKLDHRAAVRLLLVADLDHVDVALEAEEVTGLRDGGAPLAGAGLGGDALHALLLVVEGLRDGGVELVAAARRDALVLVVDAGGGPEGLLQPARAQQRGRAPQLVDLSDLLRDVDEALAADLLLDQLHREQRQEVRGSDRLLGAGVQHRGQRPREVGLDVVPAGRDRTLRQVETRQRLSHSQLQWRQYIRRSQRETPMCKRRSARLRRCGAPVCALHVVAARARAGVRARRYMALGTCPESHWQIAASGARAVLGAEVTAGSRG
jgi:hypothetical protein